MNDLNDLAEAFGKKRRKGKKEEEIIRTSFLKKENIIFEQIQGHKFMDSTGQVHAEVYLDGLKHLPITGEEVTKKTVLFPDGINEYGEIQDLITDIRYHIHKYYDCDEQTEKFAAWYVLLTWVFDRLNTINYLRAQGDWGTGKSRFGDVVGRICYKPILGSGASSVAALKRLVEKWRGTIISDEGDFKNDDEKSELVKFYNLGFEKNRVIYQCDKNDPNKLEFFIPFCPKIILTRRDFKDKALESRCLTHISSVTNKQDIPIHLPSCFYDEERILRNKLLKFRFDYYFRIDADKVLELDLGNIEPRLKQAMGSYAVLFANIPEMFESFRSYLQEYQMSLIEDRASSFDGMIVNAIVDFLLEGRRNITAQAISEKLEAEGLKSNPRTVGRHLKGLNLCTSVKKFEGKAQRILQLDDAFKEVAKRYVSEPDKVTKVTCVTLVTKSCGGVQQQLNNKKITVPDNVTDVTDVTFVTQQIKDYIQKKPKNNASYIDEHFPKELIDKLKKEGSIFEPKRGTYFWPGGDV